jgi:hypothetical protein
LIDAIKAKTDNLPASPAAVGSAMTLTSAYDAAKTAATQASVDVIDEIADLILADTAELQAEWVDGGRLDLLIDAILADTNELQTDLVNGGRLDLILDAIKAKTDSLTFTQTGQVDANVKRVEDVVLSAKTGDNFDLFFHNAGLDTTNTVDDIGSGTGTADWTDGEKEQIRQALGLTGTKAATSGGNLDAVLADTAELQLDLTNGGRLDLLIDGIKAKTDLLAFTSGKVDAQVRGLDAAAITALQSGLALEATLTAMKGAGWTTETLKAIYDQIGTRLASSGYTAPDNASITAIKGKTDLLTFTGTDVKATLDGETVTVGDKTGFSLSAAGVTAVQSGLALEATLTAMKGSGWTTEGLKQIYDAVLTRLATAGYTAPDNAGVAAIKAITDQFRFTGNDVKATLDGEEVPITAAALSAIRSGLALEATLTAMKGAGWTTQTLAALMTELTDKLDTSAYTAPDNASITAIKGKTDLLPADPASEATVAARATPAQVTTALNSYDPPTKAELDAALAALVTALMETDLASYQSTAGSGTRLADLLVICRAVLGGNMTSTEEGDGTATVRYYDVAGNQVVLSLNTPIEASVGTPFGERTKV